MPVEANYHIEGNTTAVKLIGPALSQIRKKEEEKKPKGLDKKQKIEKSINKLLQARVGYISPATVILQRVMIAVENVLEDVVRCSDILYSCKVYTKHIKPENTQEKDYGIEQRRFVFTF